MINGLWFMGSSEKVLSLIREKAAVDYPNLEGGDVFSTL